jgi:hypothetical protein
MYAKPYNLFNRYTLDVLQKQKIAVHRSRRAIIAVKITLEE